MRIAIALLALLGAPALEAELVDPTRPPDYRRAPPAVELPLGNDVWVLTGVKLAAGERLALLNGELVRPGAEVDGARVVAIRAAEVVLDKQGQRITVPLLERDVKRPAARQGAGS